MNNLERVNRALEVYGATDIYILDWEYEDEDMYYPIIFTKGRFKCFCNLYMIELALLDTPGDCEIYIHAIQYGLDKYDNIDKLEENKDLYNKYLEIVKPRKGKECFLDLFVTSE